MIEKKHKSDDFSIGRNSKNPKTRLLEHLRGFSVKGSNVGRIFGKFPKFLWF